MKKRNFILYLYFCFLALNYSNSNAQSNWQSLARGVDREVRCFYEDSVNHVLYIGGSFKTANGDTVSGIAKWNGSDFSPLGLGMDYNMGNFPHVTGSIIQYNNELYATGGFNIADTCIATGIAKWNGSSWSGIGKGLVCNDGSDGGGNYFTIYNDELYLVGLFDSINGISAHGLAKYDGITWSSVHNLPLLNSDLNRIFALEFYNNELYIGGLLNNSALSINSLVKWDGNNWVAIPGIYGGMSSIGSMCIYKNKLYVAGTFSKNVSPNNPGNYIAAWDGNSWSDLGGGVLGLYGYYNGQVHDMMVHDNFLYVVGVFQTAGGVPAQYIARWDGYQWCGLGSIFDNTISSVGFYQDTLYVGGGFWMVDGDSMNYIAKWTGGSFVDSCGNSTSMQEFSNSESELNVFPNPFATSTSIQLSKHIQNAELSIYDVLGKEIKHLQNLNGTEIIINMEGMKSGMYFFVLSDKEGIIGNGKMMVE